MIILASTSPIRQLLLTNAGVAFEVKPPKIDEANIKNTHHHLKPQEIAKFLSQLKAIEVSARTINDIVVAADQTLELNDICFDKPKNPIDAIQQLRELQGRTHLLHTAANCAIAGTVTFSVCTTASLTMRPLTDEYIEAYVQTSSPAILNCVGCYQLEHKGIQLFEKIDGDYFSVLGLPLLPLLGYLRQQGHILS